MRKWPPTHVQRGGLTKTQTTPEGRLHSENERRAINRTWSQVTWPLLVGDTATTLKLTLAAFPMYGQECFVRIESFNVPIPPHTCLTQNPSDVQTKSCLNCELWILIQQHYWRAEPINWFYIDTLLWCSNLPQVLAPAFDIHFKPVKCQRVAALVWKASAVKSWKVCYSSRIYFCRRKSQKSDRTQDLLLLSWIGDWPGKQLEKNYILRILSYFWWHNQEIGWQWLFEATGREN